MLRKQHFFSLCTWYTSLLIVVTCDDYKGFDDSILFKLNWPGADYKFLDAASNLESIVVTTHSKEKYKCLIPSTEEPVTEDEPPYEGPSAFDLVTTLFSSTTCSYRIESYWTYEICHGSYVKQFHEEREGKSIKIQEYFLGKWNKDKTVKFEQALNDAEKKGDKFRTIRIDGVNLPYLEVEMTDGTFCELNEDHRITKVQYVCYPHGKNEVYSLKETSTCNYEVVILAPALCVHPKFNPKHTGDNTIQCVPLGDAPTKPRSLLMMEVDNLKKVLEISKAEDTPRVSIVKFNPKDGTIKSDILTSDMLDGLNLNEKIAEAIAGQVTSEQTTAANTEDAPKPPVSPPPKTPIIKNKVNSLAPVIEFLEGKNCLTGVSSSSSWWKYEFCYGRYVRQFHEDKNGVTSLLLGTFDEEAHKDWLKANPQKRPKKYGARKEISHFYQGGSICEETGKNRQTEVQLKCIEGTDSMTKVSISLQEPNVCQYLLTVESSIVCKIIQEADDDALINLNTVTITDDEYVSDSISENELKEALEKIFN